MSEAVVIIHMTYYNLGRHVYLILPAQVPLYFRVRLPRPHPLPLPPSHDPPTNTPPQEFYVSIVIYCAGLLFLKLTFIFQYYRVLAVSLQMRLVYWAAMFIVGAWALSQTLIGIFACTPVAAFWDKTIPNARCIPNLPQFHINAAGNIITDVAVFALPLPAIWKLNLVRAQKVVLTVIFSLGFFTVVISIIRIRYLGVFEDFTWENAAPSMWSTGELTSALTCACLPTLKPFVAKFFPGLGDLLGRTTGAASGGSGKPAGSSSMGGKNWASGKFARSGGDKSGAMSLHSRTEGDEEGRGSEVELANVREGGAKSPFDAAFVTRHQQRREISGRGSTESVSSLGSTIGRNGGVPVEARGKGVGVRTSIRPERRRTGSNGQGVQVRREVVQVRGPM